MKKLMLLPLVIFALACSSSNGDKKGDANKGGGQADVVDTTNYQACDMGTPRSDIQGAWRHSMRQNDINLIMTMEVNQNSTRLTSLCSLAGYSLQASVTTSSVISATSISFLESKRDDEHFNEHGTTLNCSAFVSPSSAQYSFKGSCLLLKLQGSGETLTFIPAY